MGATVKPSGGRETFFLVSHSLAEEEKDCHRTIWLLDGEVGTDGDPSDVRERYREWARDGASTPGPAAGDGAEAVPE